MKRIVIEVEDEQLPKLAYGELLNVEVDAWGPAFKAMFVEELKESESQENSTR